MIWVLAILAALYGEAGKTGAHSYAPSPGPIFVGAPAPGYLPSNAPGSTGVNVGNQAVNNPTASQVFTQQQVGNLTTLGQVVSSVKSVTPQGTSVQTAYVQQNLKTITTGITPPGPTGSAATIVSQISTGPNAPGVSIGVNTGKTQRVIYGM